MERNTLLEALNKEMRTLSALSVLFSHTMAERIGLYSTDMECLDILSMTGPVPAGRLADLTGLTTGAITGVIDRLEHAGYVERRKDPQDRRRVIVQPLLEKIESKIGPLFASISTASEEILSRYSDKELATILDFLSKGNLLLQQETAQLRENAQSPEDPITNDV